jgi:hypothetical protein
LTQDHAAALQEQVDAHSKRVEGAWLEKNEKMEKNVGNGTRGTSDAEMDGTERTGVEWNEYSGTNGRERNAGRKHTEGNKRKRGGGGGGGGQPE